jgi:hypothetical protein
MADEVNTSKILTVSEIKSIAKASGKRVGKDFIVAFAELQRRQLEACLTYHNAGKKTLDAGLVQYMFPKK